MDELTYDDVDFYEKLHKELEFSLGAIKKSLDIIIDMRVEAALMELEYTSMLDANGWKQLGELAAYVAEDSAAGTEISK